MKPRVMRRELFISGRESRDLSSVKRRRRIADTLESLSFSPQLVPRARIRQECTSCLVSESIIEESRAWRARRKKVKEEEESARASARSREGGEKGGGKRERSGSLLETLVERCLTGTCCWWHTSNEYLPLFCSAHSRPTTLFLSSSFSFSCFALRSFRGARYFIPPSPPACHCTCLLGYTSCFFRTRGSGKGLVALEKAVKERNDKLIILCEI